MPSSMSTDDVELESEHKMLPEESVGSLEGWGVCWAVGAAEMVGNWVTGAFVGNGVLSSSVIDTSAHYIIILLFG